MNKIYWSKIDSPIGALYLAASPKGLCSIDFGCQRDSLPLAWFEKHFKDSNIEENAEHIDGYASQLHEYFQGSRIKFDFDIDLIGTQFQKKVWEALMDVEYGATATYKDIARKISNPRAVRAVGGANNKNPLPIVVPCHRIIGSNNSLVGYGGGLDIKKFLLALEGVKLT